MINKLSTTTWLCTLLLAGCAVGPDYHRPAVSIPVKFKEAPAGWKIAEPQDQLAHGQWWVIFNDPQLCQLEEQANNANQNIAVAAAQYQQARALLQQARSAYFPTVGGSATITRQQATSTTASDIAPFTNRVIGLDAAWEPDLWGGVRRSVEAGKAGAEASAAQLAAVRLATQATLAQTYFQIRTLDSNQVLFDKTVTDYEKALQLVQNRYYAGVAGHSDVMQAQTQLDSARAQAINNGISRAQYEHALSVLIGQPPAMFALPARQLNATPPAIPLELPSNLLERRPDIAQAERLMAQANANIGVAKAAYFPDLGLSASRAVALLPTSLGWSIGAQLSQTLLDGSLRAGQTAAARASCTASVASYRQTVLAAFQEVEDNLVALRLLGQQAKVQNKTMINAKRSLQLITNQYKAGTVSYSDVLIAQTTAYAAEKIAVDIAGLRMSAAVGLVKALGGGWSTHNSL